MSLKIHTDTTDSSDLVSRKNGATTWALGLLLLVGVLFAGGRTVRASLPVISIGEVNANDVYVRSGDSTNHYTVCKLMAGERVRVVSESGNWFEILPPPCAFSLVSGDYVTIDEQRPNVGVINGDNVRIRTGSAINNNKYTIQTKLSRGAEVQVIGQNPDGFYRIKPPAGATVWISRDFVVMVPDGVAIDAGSPSGNAGVTTDSGKTSTGTPTTLPATVNSADGDRDPQAGPTSTVAGDATATNTGKPGDGNSEANKAAGTKATSSQDLMVDRKRLEALDKEIEAEIAKPIGERVFAGITTKLMAIAEGSNDEVARKYATIRLGEVDKIIAFSEAAARLRELDRTAREERTRLLQGRTNMPQIEEVQNSPFDAFGEFRRSAVYSDGVGPSRFRLVTKKDGEVRTVAYVEMDASLDVDINELIGRRVGVRASSKRLLPGGVDVVPILVAVEIRPMDQIEIEVEKTPVAEGSS